jgi:peptidoglycan hydrolase-like protein with peptidoglycan-binding domain
MSGDGRRRRRIRGTVGIAAGVLVIAAGAAAAVGFGGADAATPTRSNLPPATVTVDRTTLTQTETVSGILGYGEASTVKARGGGGTLTWLPAPGTIVTRGKPVYEVDEEPVVLLYGQKPLYRPLSSGVSGADVEQFEKNLSALGYDGFTVDDEYSSSTADAVREWQEDLGVNETGTVGLGQVVLAPGQVRVAEHKLAPGDPANGPVLTYTGTTRVVTVDLEVDKQQLVRKGVAATVELPDGKQVKGTVASVGTVATTSTANNQQTTTVEVTVTVADQKALGTLDEAPVSVILAAEQRKDVLAVPINALVALAEGGYGLQVVDGATTHYVAVDTGMFASGRVEVTGDGVVEGLVVGVPK